jgi:hypothetical protein
MEGVGVKAILSITAIFMAVMALPAYLVFKDGRECVNSGGVWVKYKVCVDPKSLRNRPL